MATSGNGPDPWKDLKAFDKARQDFRKMAVWRPRLIRPRRGDTYTRALLLTYHNNFQMGSNVLLLYGRTPLVRFGTVLAVGLTVSYKYYKSVQDHAKIAELDAKVVKLNAALAAALQEKIAQDRRMQEMANSWWNLRNWGWFKRK